MRSPTPTARLPEGAPRPSRHPWRSFARAVSWHRRKLAVVAAVATVLSGLAATAPPSPPTTTVVRTRAALPGGAVLLADDLQTVALTTDTIPDGALTEIAAVVGRRLAGPMTAREVLTSAGVVHERTASGPGRVLAPVRIADPEVVALLRTGEEVDVLAADGQTGKTRTVAAGARVVSVPAAEQDAAQPASGALVIFDVDAGSVPGLTRAPTTSTLTVIWS